MSNFIHRSVSSLQIYLFVKDKISREDYFNGLQFSFQKLARPVGQEKGNENHHNAPVKIADVVFIGTRSIVCKGVTIG